MVKMVPYKAFVCPCGSGDVVLRESYNPKTVLNYTMHFHDQSLSKTLSDVNFLWKEERVGLLVGSPGASTTQIYSLGSSSTPIYSPRNTSTLFFKSFNNSKLFSGNFKKCRVLKLQTLA
nr:hypothetical protein [Tanacetum cinerariifolium]